MRSSKILRFCAGSLALASLALGHGQHSQAPLVDEDADWATRHMASKWAFCYESALELYEVMAIS